MDDRWREHLISMLEDHAAEVGDHRPREPLYQASSTDTMHLDRKGQLTVSFDDLTPEKIEEVAELATRGPR